jgi:Nif-specific regulatory protein
MRARLTVETGVASPQVCDLPAGRPVRLGRNRNNHIVVEDEHASRWHAEVYDEQGRWYIREVKASTNGTRVNGARIRQVAPLSDGAEIGIGAARLRFNLDPSDAGTAEMPVVAPAASEEPASTPPSGLDSAGSTALLADELTALVTFMGDAQAEIDPYALVERALAAVHRQTRAAVCGYLALDPEDPVPRLTLPARAAVDVNLSKRLTQRAVASERAVWIGSGAERAGESDSLAAYHDAVCVPLRARPSPDDPAGAREAAFGALHVYRHDRLFNVREVRFCEVLAGLLANQLRLLRSRRALEADNSRLRGRSRRPAGPELVGASPALEQVRQLIRKIGPGGGNVLIVGESGVGKELVAEGLHRSSRRSTSPMVSVNCAAIPAHLAESELFGHKKGAFTDARADRAGYFQQADEGTLFLDEIGELSLENQARLLRVLDSKKVRPLGAVAEIQVDVRVIAATNRDLEKEVRDGTFRRDLFFRLGAAPIKVPPLRERPEDVPVLARHFLELFNEEYRHRACLSEAALQRLQNYSWPGNVRQLRSVLETAVAMTPEGPIHAGDLHLVSEDCAVSEGPDTLNLEALEAWAIRQALERTGGNNTRAAEALGIHRDTLINKMKKYRISRQG